MRRWVLSSRWRDGGAGAGEKQGEETGVKQVGAGLCVPGVVRPWGMEVVSLLVDCRREEKEGSRGSGDVEQGGKCLPYSEGF